MIGRRFFLAAASFFAPIGAAWAGDAMPPIVDAVRARLGGQAVVRGQFEQRKKIAGFKAPLVSRGDFLVLRDRGVFWHTRGPFESTLVITRDRLVARQADGSVATRLDSRDEPSLRAINETLFALMSADLSVLARQFVVEGALVGAAGWSLVLQPKDAAMARFVSRITLEGDHFVQTVALAEAQGDGSFIRFSQQAGAASPTPEEVARFE
jgi:outer membrane lipoprotein-sorting protein